MTEADGDNSAAWVSAEAALEPWFESDCKFEDLPSELQALFRRGQFPVPGFVPYLWNESGPQRRREIARQRDFNTHPALADASEAVLEKMAAVDRWRLVASDRPESRRDARDVRTQDEEIAKAVAELATAEATLEAVAEKLGLACRAPAETGSPAGDVSAEKRGRGKDYSAPDAPLVTKMHALITARKATSPEHAARFFVKEAEGSGNDASKVARLAKRYREAYGPKS